MELECLRKRGEADGIEWMHGEYYSSALAENTQHVTHTTQMSCNLPGGYPSHNVFPTSIKATVPA